MKTSTLYFLMVALLGFATLGQAEIIDWVPCHNSTTEGDCTVHKVDIQPCKKAADEKICRLKKNSNATITVDFTPNFSGMFLNASTVWVHYGLALLLPGMSTDACDWTPCPAVEGRRQTYNYTTLIQPHYPTHTYRDVQWRLRNAENKECCIAFNVTILPVPLI